MNPISQGRTPNSASTYREQYMSSLMLDISNMNRTLNASRGIVSTGATGAPPVDGRSLTEKYADIDALKVMIRNQLKAITDGQNAQDIVYELTTNELEFLVGRLPFIISDLKPKFQLGVPAEIFIPYLRKLMKKAIETQGVEYGLQEVSVGQNVPPPSINNLMPVKAFEQLMYDLDDILAIPDEGDLQSVGSFDTVSLAPSESSSRYDEPIIDFGNQFGSVARKPIKPIRQTILALRDRIHNDMIRIIDAWPSQEDQQAIDACPDPFIVEHYQETLAEFADTLPSLQQMSVYRDKLDNAIRSGDQATSEQIIKEWSAIISNVDYNVMEDAKAIVRQAKEETLGLDEKPSDEPLFPEDADDFLSNDAVIRYFEMLQTAPQTASSLFSKEGATQGATQGEVPEQFGEEDEPSVMTEMTNMTEPYELPIISLTDFERLSPQHKREYITIIGEIIPEGALGEFFDEVEQGEGSVFEIGILDAFDEVYPQDENAMGTDESLYLVYQAMLASRMLDLNIGEPLLSDTDEINALPSELVGAILGLDGGPIESSPEQLQRQYPEAEAEASIEGNGVGLRMCSGRDTCKCMRCSKKMKAGKLPIGKGKNIIMGRGLMTPKVSSRVTPENIDFTIGVKVEPAYVPFGKHLVNNHRLNVDNILMLRTKKGGVIASVPTQKVSRGLAKILKTMISNENPDFESLNALSDEDKNVLYKISKTSHTGQSVPNPNKTAQEKEDSRFELLRGQIASGQDNQSAVKEFKLLLVKMMNQKRIPRGQCVEILEEMASLGL